MPSISDLFNVPFSARSGISSTFRHVGTIIRVSPISSTASVLSSEGVIDNVRIPSLHYSPGTNIQFLPKAGDVCTISYDIQQNPYISGFLYPNAEDAIASYSRLYTPPGSYVFTTRYHSLLSLTDDILLATYNGNAFLVSGSPTSPMFVFSTPLGIRQILGVPPDVAAIYIIKEENQVTQTLEYKENKVSFVLQSDGSLTITKDDKVTFSIDKDGNVEIEAKSITFKVENAESGNLALADKIKEAITNALTNAPVIPTNSGYIVTGPSPTFSGVESVANLKVGGK